MSIYFSEKFKQLRKKADLTQEQIADMFNVSPQSVSRWETGANYPDIEILPHIAFFFKVTVDELLGTESIQGEKKAKEYIKDIRNLLNSGRAEDAVNMARKAVKEYPVNYRLQGHLLQSLCAVCSGKPNEAQKNLKNEITATGEKVINYCSDPDIYLWVKWQLIRKYAEWGMKEEAKKIVYTLPSEAYYTQELTLKYVLEGEEWLENQKNRIIRFTIMLCDFIREYSDKTDENISRKIECRKAAMQIEELTRQIHGCEDSIHLENAFQNIDIAELYCEAGNIENALDYVEKSTRDSMFHIDVMDETNEEGGNYYAWATPRNLCWILWEDYLVKPCFDIVRNDERFIKCFDELKSNSRELKRY